jgi:cytoskeleton protein RodZ
MTEPLPALADKASAGALLRAAREMQGLHIAALAAAIKVAPRKLDALENDRWDELPDATFTRALAQTVCRTLKIDARPILDLLPHPGAVALEHGIGGLNAPFQGRPGVDVPGFAGAAIRPMVLAAAVLMVAALVVYFLPPGLLTAADSSPVDVSAPVPLPASAAVLTAPAASVATVAGAAAESAAPAAPEAAGETVFSAPPPAEAASAQASAVAGLVQIRTNEASWIDVRDASGQVLLSRTVLPGESVGLDGAVPIRLIIGNASATQLGFRGQPVDLVPRTRDNVARIELP